MDKTNGSSGSIQDKLSEHDVIAVNIIGSETHEDNFLEGIEGKKKHRYTQTRPQVSESDRKISDS